MSSLHSKSSTKPSSIPLYRRLLFPDLSPSAPVPPILPYATQDLNAELYDFIALALRAYVIPWWSKITRYDSDFLPHVASVIVAIVRVLAARLEKADLEDFVFRAVPVTIAQHYSDYRAAVVKSGSAYANGGAATLSQLFHQHQNHMAIDADGRIDPTYIRHLVDLVLHECLSLEDRESDAERSIIREVIVKVIMQDSIPLLCQPWFIYKLMLDQLTSGQDAGIVATKVTEVPESQASNSSIHGVVVFVLSAIQYLSGLCLILIHWYKQGVNLAKRVNATPEIPRPKQQREFALNLLNSASEVLNARSRMAASVIFTVLESLAGLFQDFADRVLVYMLRMYVMTEQQITTMVRLSKQTLFPNGYPGSPMIVPPAEEQVIIREQLIRELEIRIPRVLSSVLLGPGSTSREGIAEALEPFSSEACNAHLVLFLLDLIVLTLFPEFGVEESADELNGSSNVNSSVSPTPSPEPETEENVQEEVFASDRGRSDALNGR